MENVYFNDNFVRKTIYGTMLQVTYILLHYYEYTANNHNYEKKNLFILVFVIHYLNK